MGSQRISRVAAGSVADQAGVRAGDVLVRMNGHIVRDLIDYEAFACRRHIALEVARGGNNVTIELDKDRYEPLGLGFDEMLLSPQRNCVNHCVFCFVDQLPACARPTLRVKDDDWRMSLMMGNFVTLTNVSDKELARIIRRRCSPLYVSVHATDPQLRAMLLGQKLGAKIMDQLRALAEAGLSFHTQAVLCPGLNDGEALARTMEDLYALRPAALSLALVPVGLTGHREGLYPVRPFDRGGAARVLEQAEAMRERALREIGDPFVHPSDEFYLLAGRDFPPDEAYGEYPQIENGVGLCRLLMTQYERAHRAADLTKARSARVLIACGTSVAPVLKKLLDELPVPGVTVQVLPVKNTFFGETVTVSGLLTGGDLIRALKGIPCDRLLISQAMLREGETVFLDDMALDEVEAALGKKITPVRDGEALLSAVAGWNKE